MYFDQIKAELVEAQDVLNKFVSDDNNIKLIEKAAKLLAESFKNGGKVLSCGNGGSHCDAMHFCRRTHWSLSGKPPRLSCDCDFRCKSFKLCK